MKIQMVDLKGQYQKIKPEVDKEIQEVMDSCGFINGAAVKQFKASLEAYLNVSTVIPVGNGTDALQIALMAIGAQPGDEVIVPAFTYVATAEVIALLRLKPVMVDVDSESFNLTADIVKDAITDETKAIVPVNLYGQNAELEAIRTLADEHGIYVIEDSAQSIGSDYKMSDGSIKKSGTIGHIGCTSFYPSKNLGAYGDGGAIFTNDDTLGEKIHMIANHGQSRKYVHDVIGCNSRLDSIQAAILDVKLKHLDEYASSRQEVADRYDIALMSNEEIQTPVRVERSTHVFHQYTLKVKNGKRDALKEYLQNKGIPTMIYYPIPLYEQEAFKPFTSVTHLPITDQLCKEVLSLPIHTEMTAEEINYITTSINDFFND